MKIYLYNTLTGEKEVVKKPKGRPLRLFVCGPTVYDLSHIGHARTYLVFDALVKFLRAIKRPVFYLQNITDVDDKIISRAKKDGTSPASVAKRFLNQYVEDMRGLGINSVTKYASATKYIPQIVAQVQALIKKGFAYEIPGDGYYFDILKFSEYGKLSRRTAAQAEDSVSRIDEGVNKRNKGDFALWKFSSVVAGASEPAWPSPFGPGRPGWHIEDTSITEYFFGPQYDLHGGGSDLKFPHHEAEIAQQEAASGKKPFVKIWLHTGPLTINNAKMSKSLGNFLTIQDFLKKYPAEVLRLLVLSYHYRTPFDYTEKLARENEIKWRGILEFMAKIDVLIINSKNKSGKVKVLRNLDNFAKEFQGGLADDFNTPRALAAALTFISSIQPQVWELSKVEATAIRRQIQICLKMLGFSIVMPKIPPRVRKLAREREQLRRNQQFMQSDGLRKKINYLGFVLEDTPSGPFLWPRS